MKMLLSLLVGGAMLAWTAGPAEKSLSSAKTRPAAEAFADRPTTAPAGGDARPMVGPRRRLLEAPGRREGGPTAGAGRRRAEKAQPALNTDDPLPAAKVEELMQFARENFPQLHERLERLRQVKPEEFHRMLRKARGPLQPIIDVKERDQRLAQKMIDEYRLQLAITYLYNQYGKAKSDAERERIKTELKVRIRERFDRHQERTRMEIEHLRSRLDEQERRMADRESRKEDLLREEFDRVMQGSFGPSAERQAKAKGQATND